MYFIDTWARALTLTHTHTHTQASKHTHTLAHRRMHKSEHTHLYKHIHTQAHKTHGHAKAQTRPHRSMRAYTHTHTHTHTCPSFVTPSPGSETPCPSRPLVRRVAQWNPYSAPYPVSSATHRIVVYCVHSIGICSPAHDNDFASDYISPLCLLY
jgi:hypothetical protein